MKEGNFHYIINGSNNFRPPDKGCSSGVVFVPGLSQCCSEIATKACVDDFTHYVLSDLDDVVIWEFQDIAFIRMKDGLDED